MFKRKSVVLGSCFCCILVFFAAGCSQPQGELFPELTPALVWPGPPDKPRFKYVGLLSKEEDLKKAVTWSLGELIFGKKEKGALIAPYAVAVGEQKLFVTDVSVGSVHIFDLNRKRQLDLK